MYSIFQTVVICYGITYMCIECCIHSISQRTKKVKRKETQTQNQMQNPPLLLCLLTVSACQTDTIFAVTAVSAGSVGLFPHLRCSRLPPLPCSTIYLPMSGVSLTPAKIDSHICNTPAPNFMPNAWNLPIACFLMTNG